MTKFGKLVLIGVLAGTLGLVGCGDDGSSNGTGGTAGSGGSAGSGGEGGSGGVQACGEGESIDQSFVIDTGTASCNGLDVITVPIEVVLAANAEAPLDGETSVDVQVSLNMSEETVAQLGALGVQQATIGEASADVDEVGGSNPVNVPATVPCEVDFTADPDDNGAAGPIEVPTPVQTAMWTAVDGSIVIEAVDITFAITAPVPLNLSTAGAMPACTWEQKPSVTLPAM
jgi:hypothetical protein